MHICGPELRYPYSAVRIYTPPDALLPAYIELAETLGIGRVVFVQPSIYGTDNSAMLAAMQRCGLPCRGVAVIDHTFTDRELDALHAAGVRGVRVNLVDTAQQRQDLPVDELHALAERIARQRWHLELLLHVDDFPHIDRELDDLPVDIVLGHFGYLRHGNTIQDPGFQALLRLLATGRCWVKLTGPYRLTPKNLPYPSVTPMAHALVAAAPERVIWGSDWPHVMVKTTMPNDGELLDLLADWIPDAATRERILVNNAALLYDF
jgi:predicted TIM-barrel fold metal-dependent hydrolase